MTRTRRWMMEDGGRRVARGGSDSPAPSSIFHRLSSILHPRARAFSFTEVMFAVIILGIGFIMVAAIFPVAIQQNQATSEESGAAAIAKEAAATIAASPQTYPNPPSTWPGPPLPAGYPQSLKMFPPTVKNFVLGSASGAVAPPAVVVPFVGPRWDAIKNNLILPSDNRLAYVPFYRRENGASSAQLIVIGVTIRNRSIYEPAKDVANYAVTAVNATTSSFGGNSTAPAQQTQTGIYADTITAAGGYEGEYITVPQNMTAPKPSGRTYRLGRLLTTGGFELDPADMMSLGPSNDGTWGTFSNFRDAALTSDSCSLIPPATLQPTTVYAQLSFASGSIAGQIQLFVDPSTAATAPNGVPASAVTGAFVIIADDYPFDPSAPKAAPPYLLPLNDVKYQVGAVNGRIFRLGAAVAGSPGLFNLDPTFGMSGSAAASPDTIPNPELGPGGINLTGWTNLRAKAFIIGAGLTDPTRTVTPNPPSGQAQDIAVYTTFFQVN
jgi:hypothetical protein